MKKRGRGCACMFYPVGSTAKANPTAAVIKVNHDGTVTVFVGVSDIGQGSSTVLAQIVVEELGVPFAAVRMVTADTELTPYDSGTGASRVTYIAGNALKNAAAQAKAILHEVAAQELGVDDPAELSSGKGRIYLTENPERSISIGTAAWTSERVEGRPVVTTGYYNPSTSDFDAVTGQGNPFEVYSFATQVAEVEVDTKTGEVEILRIVAVHDCGRAINPLLTEGQVQGGVVMGVGQALLEDIWEDDATGHVINNSFTDYLVPTAVDSPGQIEIHLLEEDFEKGPFGAKGIGEPTALPTAPAIMNAIYDAIGVRIYDLPATPEKILRKLKEKNNNERQPLS